MVWKKGKGMLPELVIDLSKMKKNIDRITALMKERDCSVMFVTKGMCGDRRIAELAAANPDISYLADSRIRNIRRYSDLAEKYGKKTVLLRLPAKSNAYDTVRYTDVSLNSNIEVISALDEAAGALNRIHEVILMIDLGDLREGVFFEDKEKILSTAGEILRMRNIRLLGIGTNLSCYGGVVPDEKNLGCLCDIAEMIENEFGIRLEVVSGGNSTSIYLAYEGRMPEKINNLRIGGRYYHGCPDPETRRMEEAYDDAVTLNAEIIELYEKPSVPVGKSGRDAFGGRPVFEDRGVISRAVLAIGQQDTDAESMVPFDEDIDILGASSDHLIMDISGSDKRYRVGDTVSFRLHYLAMMRAATSEYVDKVYLEEDREV